jgi:hypothetical protein
MASDWVTLARRLDIRIINNLNRVVVGEWAVGEQQSKSLLVGETLRVANLPLMAQDDREIDDIADGLAVKIFASQGDARATACLALLDAVGYQP